MTDTGMNLDERQKLKLKNVNPPNIPFIASVKTQSSRTKVSKG